jgi:hypothetical protein
MKFSPAKAQRREEDLRLQARLRFLCAFAALREKSF